MEDQSGVAFSVLLLSSPSLADYPNSVLDYVDEVRATHQVLDLQFATSNVQLDTSSCSAPRTLMQWSYGTSFRGGPDLDEPLVTDRPDFTESGTTVGLGVAQLEMGYTYSFDQTLTNSVENHSYGEPLLRIGMFAEWFELRVGWNYANEITTTAGIQGVVAGSEDLYLGVKIALTPQECFFPEMALIPQMTLPTASTSNFGDGTVLPGVNWIY
ncbi:MAG: transporter, partial [Planctomycetes bacterium]|nr:transporter [Planctomycetota bacterium]